MKPKYPTEIVPCSHYKRRMGTDDLLIKYPNLLVVRLVEGRLEDYFLLTENGDKELKSDVFKNSLANLSMNLSGGLFNTDCNAHLRFLPATKEAAATWDGEHIPEKLYATENCYHFYETCFGLCFYVCNIHNRTFPFYKHFDSQEERDKYADEAIAATSESEKEYDAHFVGAFENRKVNVLVKPRIKVNHSPTKVNYWHMALDTYRPTDLAPVDPTEKQDSADKKMFKALKQDLMQNYIINLHPEYTIESCDYIIEP